MSQDRLDNVQTNLELLYEQLAGEEEAFILAEEANKTRIQQKIRKTEERIRIFEQEYAKRLSQKITQEHLSESIAEEVVAEIIDEIEILKPLEKRDEIQVLLQQILAELQKPDTPASAKLKVALPIFPTLVNYELEVDTESIIQRLFPTFVKACDGFKSSVLKKN